MINILCATTPAWTASPKSAPFARPPLSRGGLPRTTLKTSTFPAFSRTRASIAASSYLPEIDILIILIRSILNLSNKTSNNLVCLLVWIQHFVLFFRRSARLLRPIHSQGCGRCEESILHHLPNGLLHAPSGGKSH